MRFRARSAAWLLWTVAIAIAMGAVVLLVLTRSTAVDRLGTVPRGLEAAWTLLLVAIFSTMGALIASRRPDNLIGWSFLVAGIGLALNVFATDYVVYATRTDPGSLPLLEEIAWLKNWVPNLTMLSAFAALLLLFPDGALPSRRWRPVAWLVVTWITVLSAADFIRPPAPRLPGNPWLRPDGIAGPVADTMSDIAWLGGNIIIPAAVAAVVVRLRGSRGQERQQLKWLALAGGVVATGLLLLTLTLVLRASGWITSALADGLAIAGGGLAVAGMTAMPVATAVAIYKYRLYDIDRIISRSVAYGVLTVVLAAVYAAAVLTLEPLLRPLTGESTLAVAASTLIVVAVSQPLRNRIRSAVDRRFNRRRYNAVRTIEAFSARLRDEVDLGTLSDEMLAVVGRTVEPRQVTIWLRPMPGVRIRP